MACACQNNNTNLISSMASRELYVCEYTMEMMVSWKALLDCVKENEIYTSYGLTRTDINSYLGTVLSGISFEYNICFLTKYLDKIKPFIIQLVNDGVCSNI